MIFDALRRLDRFTELGRYRYVGFASPFFVDFKLAHRELGIGLMTNIEVQQTDKDRFNFNRPFGFIDLEWGEAATVVEALDWAEPTILWLDFDKPLRMSQLSTIQIALGLLPSGSVLIVTTVAQPEHPLDERIEILTKALGDYMPFDLTDPELLGGWSTAELYRKIIADVIEQELAVRNEGLPPDNERHYQQWFNFHYKDSSRMLTVGGILFDTDAGAQVDGMGMDDFPFVCGGEDAYVIDPPNLTFREMAYLESRFPCAPDQAGLPFLNEIQIQRHQELYRYAPRFADVDI